MANEFPHKHIIGYVHVTPNIEIDNIVSATDHSTYCASSIFGVYAKNGRQAIDVCAETGTTYINGVDPVAAYAYTYNAIPQLENIINGKLNNYIKEHDVFHFGGTFDAGAEQGNFGTFSYLKNDSMVIVGTTVKVQNDGWFGNYNVHAGDLLIAYSDSATRNSTTYWDVIETHLGPLNSQGTYTQTNKPNFLTNIYLNDNGDLSYSYSYFTQVHTYVNNGTASDLDSLDNDTNVITTVVSNVNFDASGKFSYQLHNLTNAKSHHSQQRNEIVEQSVITNLSLSSKGHLTYTASVLTETSSTSGNITVGDANNESFTLIDGIKQSGNGSVSYHYKTITVSNSHHGGNVTASTYNFVDKVELSATGTLSGSTKNIVANSNKIYVTTKNTEGSYYIPFFDGSGTEYKTAYIDSNLYYDPETNTAYISDIYGDVNGNVTGSFTGAIYTSTSNTSYAYAIPFLSKRDTNGFSYTYVDSKNSLTWNPNTDTISLKNISASGNATVEGYLNNKTNITTTGYVKSATLQTTGNTTIAGYLNNNTNITTTGYVKSATLQTTSNAAIAGYLNVTGNETVNGYLTVNGNTTLGNAETDVIKIKGDTTFNADVDIDKTLNVDGDVTIGGKLSITDSTKVDNLNADMLDGMHISGIDNKYWGTVTYVKSGDGVMEIGKYIDFHHNKEGESDYSTRISSQNTSTKNTITLPTNDGTLHVGDFIKSDAGDKELDTTTSSNGLAVLTGLSFDTTTGKVSYCTHDIYHGNSDVTPGTYGLDATKTYTLNNCQFFVPEFTVNVQGHITAASEKLITISPNTVDVASKTHTHSVTTSGTVTLTGSETTNGVLTITAAFAGAKVTSQGPSATTNVVIK